MKITKRQLRRIIAEQLALVPVENLSGDQPAVIGDGGDASMARGQLFNIAKKAQSLQDKLSDEDQLPEWVQSKIAVMADNMDAVSDYLSYQLHKEEMNESYVPLDKPKVITDQTGVTTIEAESARAIALKIDAAFDIINDLTISLMTSVPNEQPSRGTTVDPRVKRLQDQLDIAEEGIFGAQTAANHLADGTGG